MFGRLSFALFDSTLDLLGVLAGAVASNQGIAESLGDRHTGGCVRETQPPSGSNVLLDKSSVRAVLLNVGKDPPDDDGLLTLTFLSRSVSGKLGLDHGAETLVAPMHGASTTTANQDFVWPGGEVLGHHLAGTGISAAFSVRFLHGVLFVFVRISNVLFGG